MNYGSVGKVNISKLAIKDSLKKLAVALMQMIFIFMRISQKKNNSAKYLIRGREHSQFKISKNSIELKFSFYPLGRHFCPWLSTLKLSKDE